MRQGIWVGVCLGLLGTLAYGGFSVRNTLGAEMRASETLSTNTSVMQSFWIASGVKVSQGDVLVNARLQLRQTNEALEGEISELYGSYEGTLVMMGFGKTRVQHGVGYVWTPSDILNPTTSFLWDGHYPSTTNTAIVVGVLGFHYASEVVPFSLSWRGYVVPWLEIERSVYAGDLSLSYGQMEMSVVLGKQNNGEDIVYGGYLRSALPFVDWVTVYGEFGSVNMKTNWEFVGGMQVNPSLDFVPGSIQIQGEYGYRPEGAEDMEDFWAGYDPARDRMPLPGMLLRRYVYGGIAYTGLVVRSQVGIVKNLDEDGSGMVTGEIQYRVGEDSFVMLGGRAVLFDKDTEEFPTLLGQRWEIRFGFTTYFGIEEAL